mgnify:FL=1
MSELSWDYDEFLCFILIYAYYADIDYDEHKKKAILNLFSEEVYQRQLKVFESLNDYQALDKIMQYREKYFSTPHEKQELLHKIENQFSVDGTYSDFEKEVFLFLEKLL